jgi:hypothetical protein
VFTAKYVRVRRSSRLLASRSGHGSSVYVSRIEQSMGRIEGRKALQRAQVIGSMMQKPRLTGM